MALSTNWPTLIVEISFDNTAWYDTANTWVDVTAYVRSWGFQRGKQRQLNTPQSGTADVTLDNSDGRFDPMNASSPYYGTMKPGRMVRIRATFSGVTYGLFKGVVMDWPVTDMNTDAEPMCQLKIVDFIGTNFRGRINGKNVAGHTNGVSIVDFLPAAVAAISVIDAGTEQMYDIDSISGNLTINGNTSLTIGGTFSLFGDSETESTYFVDGSGTIIYHDHNRRHGVQPVLQAVFGNDATNNAAGTELPYEAIEVINDDTLILNEVTVQPREAATGWGANTLSTDATSSLLVGYRALTRTVVTINNVGAQRIGDQLIDLYATPPAQIKSLTVDGAQDVAGLWPKILGLEISEPIRIKRRAWPNPTTVLTYDSWIEGVTMSSSLDPLSWSCKWDLSPWISGYHPPLIGGSGVAFPTSPSSGDMFYRTDLGFLCSYDGTRWLTVNEYDLSMGGETLTPASAVGVVGRVAIRSDYTIYITRVAVRYDVLTTNNGSNFWSWEFRQESGTALASGTTAAATANVWTSADATIAATNTSKSYYMYVSAKTGAPGNVYMLGTMNYRLVVP